VLVGDLGSLELRHTTLVPTAGGLTVNASVQPELQNPTLDVRIERSICGAITLPDTVPSLTLGDTIVDGVVVAPGSHLDVEAGTLTGTVEARSVDASDTLFVGVLTVERRQQGCIRFSHVPATSGTPRRFRCQPDLAVSGLADVSMTDHTRRRVTPVFTSLEYGHPAYLQLAPRCALELRAGASDGAAMGAYHSIRQPQREANLRLRLREHLRVGLEAGFFYRT
jgi:hypothetical protein